VGFCRPMAHEHAGHVGFVSQAPLSLSRDESHLQEIIY
jgi:hypothetical protein